MTKEDVRNDEVKAHSVFKVLCRVVSCPVLLINLNFTDQVQILSLRLSFLLFREKEL